MNHSVHRRWWLSALLLLVSLSVCLAQSQLPDLAQIKAAAEGGNAAAQDRLGDSYYAHLDYQTPQH